MPVRWLEKIAWVFILKYLTVVFAAGAVGIGTVVRRGCRRSSARGFGRVAPGRLCLPLFGRRCATGRGVAGGGREEVMCFAEKKRRPIPFSKKQQNYLAVCPQQLYLCALEKPAFVSNNLAGEHSSHN